MEKVCFQLLESYLLLTTENMKIWKHTFSRRTFQFLDADHKPTGAKLASLGLMSMLRSHTPHYFLKGGDGNYCVDFCVVYDILNPSHFIQFLFLFSFFLSYFYMLILLIGRYHRKRWHTLTQPPPCNSMQPTVGNESGSALEFVKNRLFKSLTKNHWKFFPKIIHFNRFSRRHNSA